MGVTVCTGWHPAAYKEYARTFVETFDRHWPASVNLVVYTEEPAHMPRGESRSLWDIQGARDFYERHKGIKQHCGAAPVPMWRPKDVRKGYAWRWDAVRFFKQCVIPNDAAKTLMDGDILVWFDADVVWFANAPEDYVEDILGKHDLCFLGRNKGSEIGFWAVRLNPRSRAFLADLSSLYLDDRVWTLPQWHSAFVFDHARQGSGMSIRNLTPSGRDHVWMAYEPLYRISDHLKGSRKSYGHSAEHPLRWWEKHR